MASQGLVGTAADFFSLKVGDLETLAGFKDKKINNILKSIEASKNIDLAKFIYALGIRHVGEETALVLAQNFHNLNNWLKADQEQLENLSDIGPEVSRSIMDWLANNDNQKLLQDLISSGVVIKDYSLTNKKLNSKTFLFTGTLNMSREEAENLVRRAGGKILSSVGKNLNYLVSGDNPGSKLIKAKDFENIKIISEAEFIKLLK